MKKTIRRVSPKRALSDVTQDVIAGKYSTSRSVNLSNDNVTSVANSVVQITVPINNQALAAASRAFVNYALSRGWSSNTQTPNPEWYYALCRLNQIFAAYCTGNTADLMANLPRCVVQLGNLLMPKRSLPYYGGKISYSWEGVNPITDWQYSEGPSTNTATTNYGVYLGTDPNSSYPLVASPGSYPAPSSIVDDALNSMFKFCQSTVTGPATHFWENVPSNTTYPAWAEDPSAFAAVTEVDGSANGVSGGYSTIIRSELPCQRIMFSGFALTTTGTVFARFPGKQYNFSGDLLSNVGFYVSQLVCADQLTMKRPPVFKTVDFDEFLDVLCQYLCELLGNAAADPLVTVSPGTCSVNYYMLRYILAYDLRYAFSKTQPFVSRIYPQNTTDVHNDFTSLQSGTGLFSTSFSGAFYPLAFVENVRMLTNIIMYNSKGGRRNPVIYCPVLSSASGNIPSWKDYVYDYQGTSENVFPDPGVLSNPSIIDGSLGNNYVSLSDKAALQLYVSSWNDWISKFKTYSSRLSNMSIDGGAITIITTSRFCSTRYPAAKKDPKQKMTPGELIRQSLVKSSNIPNVWLENSILATTSYNKFLETMAPIIKAFVLPRSFYAIGNTDADTHYIGTEQGRTKEMNTITDVDQWGQGVTHTDLGNIHRNMAVGMVRAREGDVSSLESFFIEAEAAGKGGILSNLIGGFVKGILPAEAHGIVDTIANIVPV